jgi:Prp8 binding protein
MPHPVALSSHVSIVLWEVYGECRNYNILSGHKNAVIEIKWIPSSNHIISASADKTLALWDANKGERIRRYTEHTAVVNSCACASEYPTIFASGSDDCTAVIWDIRHKRAVQSFYHDYQVTSVAMSHDGQHLYTGGIDNIIRRYDLRKGEAGSDSQPDMILKGHHDTITGLAISPDGTRLLSNAMDSNLLCWDIRPFVAEGASRIQVTYQGATHGAEKNLLRCAWSADQNFVTCGSADRMVHIWDALSGKQLYYLPGHKGSVNDVVFHAKEPIIASCSTDKQIFLGELGVL